MRIKKIEWITIDDKSDPSSPVGKLVKTADLPIGCVALIRQYQACYRWMIKVVDLSVAFLPPIEVGETDSIEGAKKACQATWEKMVMEAFEEDACLFCGRVDKTKPINAGGDINIAVISSVDNSPGSMVIETKRFGVSIASKYCFNCGRRLGGASNVRRFG